MAKFDNILIATDLDGTLYENQNFIPQINLDKIKYFTDNGGKFTIATGRGIEAARFITNSIKLTAPAIVNNGHTLYDYQTESAIYNKSLPKSAKEELQRVLNKYPNIAAEIYCDRVLYVINPNKTLINHLEYTKVKYNNTCISDVFELKWSKVLITDEFENIEKVRSDLQNMSFDGFKYIKTTDLYHEMIIDGITKGTTLLKLADYYNIPYENTFAIGNYYNDIELIESAGCGAVVSNTPEDIKSRADFICKNTAENGALAEFIDYIESRF